MSICGFINSYFSKPVFILQVLFLIALSCKAQDDTLRIKKWAFLVEPYLIIPNIKGTTGVGSLPDVELNADPGEIFSHFKIAAILYLEMAKDRWAISSDLIYMNLDQDVKTSNVINSGNVNFKQLSFELAGLHKLLPWLEAGIGGRFNSLQTNVQLETKQVGGSTTSQSKSKTQTWLDPIVIARINSPADKKFMYQFRGDLGGFGIGSDFTWQLQAYAGYRFSKLFQATVGYRIISVDYSKGSGDDRFLYDVDTFGPVLRIGLNF
jgi:hypothetical protein